MNKRSVLVTGGAGYIGSHAMVEFLEAGKDLVCVDNLSNSKVTSLDRVKEITGREVKFYKVDLLDIDALEKVFLENNIESCIHFAGLKAVGESCSKPILYYHNNITGTLNLCKLLSKYNAKKIVFSSSATVYGKPASVPITEDFPLSTTNPYGETKLMIERILKDLWASDNEWSVSILRYFNPIGAHKSGLIGEDPRDIPNNLLPYVAQVALGRRECLAVHGNDYNTHDGTGVRDYIHVVDLAKAHLCALNRAETVTGVEYFNIGTGTGYSVLEMVEAYKKASGKEIPYVIAPRRDGDIAACYANPEKSKAELGWEAKLGLDRMCADSWNFNVKNPNGYTEE